MGSISLPAAQKDKDADEEHILESIQELRDKVTWPSCSTSVE